jgi:hypothetical protein
MERMKVGENGVKRAEEMRRMKEKRKPEMMRKRE